MDIYSDSRVLLTFDAGGTREVFNALKGGLALATSTRGACASIAPGAYAFALSSIERTKQKCPEYKP
ncbi:MAG: hypothetical protein CSA96_08565 [Bacteroidetes bacterium]|nr:MAG: hypothetical protein CSA96_08565 [Bacteroidota bacterium]